MSDRPGRRKAIDSFSARLTSLLKSYYFVGGKCLRRRSSPCEETCRRRDVQNEILLATRARHQSTLTYARLSSPLAAWTSILAHLGKENKKFVFGHIRDGARARDYRSAITCAMARLALQRGCPRHLPSPEPTRLMLARAPSSSSPWMLAFTPPCRSLMSRVWSTATRCSESGAPSPSSTCQSSWRRASLPATGQRRTCLARLIMVQHGGYVYPIEVKAEENRRAKSLAAFNRTHEGMRCRRFSLSGFRDEGWMRNVPLYSIGNVRNWTC